METNDIAPAVPAGDIDRFHGEGGAQATQQSQSLPQTPPADPSVPAGAASAKVLICTSVGESKLYALPFLLAAVRKIEGRAGLLICFDGIHAPEGFEAQLQAGESLLELPPVFPADAPWADYAPARISRVREAQRIAFLEGDWTHLYWHDSDMLPPADTITRLLACDKPVASGLYNLRGNGDVCIPATTFVRPDVAPPPMHSLFGLPEDGDGYTSVSFGMGCMLVTRQLLVDTGFPGTEFVASIPSFEDVLWCAACQHPVYLDLALCPWHVEADGTARRIVVGESAEGVAWTDSAFITNRYGEWQRGTPRYDLSEDQVALLGVGFASGVYPRLSVETARVEDIH